MAHLLMIESWVDGTGRMLPEALARAGHRYTFVTRNRKHYLDGATTALTHPVLTHADNVLTLETNDVDTLIAQLHQLRRVLRFDGVLTVCDYYIETVTHVAHALGLPSCFPTTAVDERRKNVVRERLDQAGIPNPGYRVTSSWEQTRLAAAEIGYPLVIKPTDLASSAYVRVVASEQELADAYADQEAFPRNFRDQPREQLYLLEEYLTGTEFSVEACAAGGEITVIGITDKSVTGWPHFIEDGHMFPADLDHPTAETIVDFTRRVLAAVGHDHGMSHTEVKLTPRGPRLIEINPRMAGNYIIELVQHVTGIDMIAATIALALGERPDLTPADTGVRSAAIKFLVPERGGYLADLRGADALARDENVVRYHLEPVVGSEVAEPIDNACYLGHVVTIDHDGLGARASAEAAICGLELVFAHEPPVAQPVDSTASDPDFSGVDAASWVRRWDRQQEGYLPDREEAFALMLNFLERLGAAPGRLLDLACGVGSLADRALSRFPGAEVVALDLDPLMMELGRRTLGGKVRWVEADLRFPGWDRELRDETFDAVVSATALHWLETEDLPQLANGLATIMRPGGVFLNYDVLVDPASPRIAAATSELQKATQDAVIDAEGFEDFTAWWDAIGAEPLFHELVAEREQRFGLRPRGPGYHLPQFQQAFRDAGFSELGTLRQINDRRLFVAIR
ncbi:MAG: ATP-grasp domain-containing protein [Pseudonocardiaceae bacterium]